MERTREDLVQSVMTEVGLARSEAKRVVDRLTGDITRWLAGGDDVKILGFGVFSTKVRPAGQGRNPLTGAPLQLAEARQPKFRALKGLKDGVNNRRAA